MKTQYFSRGELTSFPIPVLSGTGKKLSLSESGFFNFLFNKPEGWIFHYSEICIELSIGKNKVAAMLQKLSDEGLIQRKRQYKNGKVCGFTIDFTSPNTESSKLHTKELNTRNYIPKIENHKLYTDKTITDNKPHSYSPCENPYENKKNNNSLSLNSSPSLTEPHPSAVAVKEERKELNEERKDLNEYFDFAKGFKEEFHLPDSDIEKLMEIRSNNLKAKNTVGYWIGLKKAVSELSQRHPEFKRRAVFEFMLAKHVSMPTEDNYWEWAKRNASDLSFNGFLNEDLYRQIHCIPDIYDYLPKETRSMARERLLKDKYGEGYKYYL